MFDSEEIARIQVWSDNHKRRNWKDDFLIKIPQNVNRLYAQDMINNSGATDVWELIEFLKNEGFECMNNLGLYYGFLESKTVTIETIMLEATNEAKYLIKIINEMTEDKTMVSDSQLRKLYKARKNVSDALIVLHNVFEKKAHSDCTYYDEGKFNEYCGMSGMQLGDDEICVEFEGKEENND